jgi:hypothetical protein
MLPSAGAAAQLPYFFAVEENFSHHIVTWDMSSSSKEQVSADVSSVLSLQEW